MKSSLVNENTKREKVMVKMYHSHKTPQKGKIRTFQNKGPSFLLNLLLNTLTGYATTVCRYVYGQRNILQYIEELFICGNCRINKIRKEYENAEN